MATWKFDGLDKYVAKLNTLSNNSEFIIKRSVYDGAGYTIGEVQKALKALPVDDSAYNPSGMKFSISKIQKRGLIRHSGISSMDNESGFINVKIGADDYNELASNRWPKGQPNIMVARSLERGTSWMKKNPVYSKASRKAKRGAEEAMQKTLEFYINTIF